MDFQELLVHVDQALSKDDVKALLFLCTDIVVRDLSSLGSAKELFALLQDQDLLSAERPFLLTELLTIIHRTRLVRQLGLSGSTTSISPYRMLLYELSEGITEEDLKKIKFLLREKLPRKKLEKTTTLEVFLEMEHKDLLNETKLNLLEEIMKPVCPMLQNKIKHFTEQNETNRGPVTQETGTGRSQSTSDLSVSNQMPLPKVSERRSSCEISINFGEHLRPCHCSEGPQPLAQLSSLSPSNTSLDIPRVPDTTDEAQSAALSLLTIKKGNSAASKEKSGVENSGPGHCPTAAETNKEVVGKYPMVGVKRGFCLIVNNYDFSNSIKQLNNREGTDIDQRCLEKVFKWLGFEVETEKNCARDKMLSVVQKLRTMDHSQMDCFVCCILSHGQDRGVFGVDGQEVQLKELTEPFSALQCPSLREKPKLFFIQACQGTYEQQAVCIQSDGPVCSDAQVPKNSIPADADILMSMATVPHYVSYRDKKQGSWFIQLLCQNLVQMVPSGYHLMDILTKVNADVSQKTDSYGEKKQMPQPAFSLRKKVVFPIPRERPPSLP
ncbi:caspase-8 [Myripristis murdjan]|uniref:caspase-8 n=1 Tax=Myripristis murdjan TaxID=586833 RepID=UPI0011762C60|nr:caspase-8-like [Myripristis murdjan]